MEAMVGTGNERQGVLVTSSLDGAYICFRVIDSGSGVLETVESELFHPFFSTKAKGMGIGLSICQSIIQAHSGEIGYLKNKGGGSIFFFKLPME
jgi:signal transduction histidine kinase